MQSFPFVFCPFLSSYFFCDIFSVAVHHRILARSRRDQYSRSYWSWHGRVSPLRSCSRRSITVLLDSVGSDISVVTTRRWGRFGARMALCWHGNEAVVFVGAVGASLVSSSTRWKSSIESDKWTMTSVELLGIYHLHMLNLINLFRCTTGRSICLHTL
jgi:hypothetical protein